MRTAARRLLLALTIPALAVAACGGSTPSQGATPSAAGASATTAASTAPSTGATPPPASSGPTPAASIDLSGAANALADVSRYKFTVTTTGGDNPGTATFIVVREPVLARSFEGSFGGQTTRIIIIGTDVWMDAGSGQYMKNIVPLAVAEGLMSAFDPATLFLGIGMWMGMGGLNQVGTEEKNGVQAIHYHLDKTTIPPGASIDPDTQVDLWVAADGGYLVSMRTTGLTDPGSPTSIAMDISNIDDPNLVVTAPN